MGEDHDLVGLGQQVDPLGDFLDSSVVETTDRTVEHDRGGDTGETGFS